MTFNLDSVNNRVIHCTNQFETDILADDWNQTSTYYGGYTLNTGGTANTIAQTGVVYGGTMDTTGLSLRKVWDISVGKYERIKYKFDIFTDTDHDTPDVNYAIQIPASSTVHQYRAHTHDVDVPVAGSTDELKEFVEELTIAINSSNSVPNGTYVKMNNAANTAFGPLDGVGYITVSGIIEASSTAGKLGFYFGQNTTSSEASRVKAGSTFQYLRF
jgi:hypothetical protein